MRALLSTIGSRGDVQPLVALAHELRALGHDARFCVPPNFAPWVESLGFACVPVGPDVKQMASNAPAKPVAPSDAQRQALAEHMVRDQFRVVAEAARGCDVIVAWGALQIATRSVAETLGLPYVYVTFCPTTLPSPDHAPPRMDRRYLQSLPGVVNRVLWSRDEQSWRARFLDTLNVERARAGLAPVASLQRHVFTDRPWLAADATLAPAASSPGMDTVQTGAWMLRDGAALPAELEHFLMTGEPPILFSFGSMRGAEHAGQALIDAAHAVGRRAILSQGWSNLGASAAARDVISIGDVDFARLLPRLAVVVHHGGAGTTTAAARAGTAQVIVPHLYDQFYWARRVTRLRVGATGPTRARLTARALVPALREALRRDTATHARELASRISSDGAQIAARRLAAELAETARR